MICLEFRKATVVGAGIMGHGIAEVIALSGIRVSLEDAYPDALEKAKQSISSSLDRLVKSGKITPDKKAQSLQLISFHSDLKESLEESSIVIEAVPEIPDLKRDLIGKISRMVSPETIIGSNTSNIMISDLAKQALKPQNVVGIHFFNPPVVLKLVEVIKSQATSNEAFEGAFEFVKKLGKVPIKVMKDTPGFVVNRINAPESLLFGLIAQNKMAKPSEVDAFAKAQGLPMGPYELMDYVGIDTMAHSLRYYAEVLHPDYGKCTIFSEMVNSKLLGMKTGQGFYRWEGGHAVIEPAEPTSVVDLLDVLSLEVNEAVRLIEEGVAEPGDI
ncbi:MAG: 3-hydroxyacyl-CoA dehydrogenase family protein, partial [Thermoplasmataceae archaeon]